MLTLGKAYIKVDGALLRSNPGAKIDLGGVVREPVIGASAVHGYTEKIKESTIECEITLAEGDSLKWLRESTDVTVTFECDSGQVFVVRNAWLVDPPVVTAAEGGKIPIKLAGPPAEEV